MSLADEIRDIAAPGMTTIVDELCDRVSAMEARHDDARAERTAVAEAMCIVFMRFPKKSEGRQAIQQVLDVLGVPR